MPIAERPAAPADLTHDPNVKVIHVTAYLYPQGGRWFAAATEYLLMAEGADEEEAKVRFLATARAYFATAIDHGWLDAINRRPSFFRRWEIRLRWRLAWLLFQHPRLDRQTLRFA